MRLIPGMRIHMLVATLLLGGVVVANQPKRPGVWVDATVQEYGVDQTTGQKFALPMDSYYVTDPLRAGIIECSRNQYAEAAQRWREAAMQGNVGCQTALGALYLDGKGVTQDFAEAYVWICLSAASGSNETTKLRDRVAKKLSQQTLEQAQARARKLQEEIQANKDGNQPNP